MTELGSVKGLADVRGRNGEIWNVAQWDDKTFEKSKGDRIWSMTGFNQVCQHPSNP